MGLLAAALAWTQPADLVLRNGKIVTMDAAAPQVEALAVRGDTIWAVGSDESIAGRIGPRTRVIDLAGKLAIPGFIEGHGHFTGIGQARMTLDLRGARSWDEVVARVREAASKARPGAWIVGRGWHQAKWERPPEPNVQGFPVHALLSHASERNPVLLAHASGHAAMVNRLALQQAGITAAMPNPPGGEILRDARGEATGLLLETAQALARAAYNRDQAKRSPAEREDQARTEIELAARECLAKGVTSFQDAGSSFAAVDLLRKLAGEGKLGVRLWVMLRESNQALEKNLARYRIIDYADKRLTVRAIKRSVDGALGPRGAWLLAPYADLPSSSGLNTTPLEEIARTAKLALEHGFQLATHAIGDRANREVLDLYEQTFGKYPDRRDLRWRIEHAQHLAASDIPRFGKLEVIASMQGIHCTSDAPFVIPRLGAGRAEEGAYVWQKLLRSGAVVTNGTDAPVEDVDPIASFHASVSRKLKDGGAFYPEQRMSREEALRSYTLSNAYAAFEEGSKGSLAPGKLADIVVLSKDIMTAPADEIPGARVLYTIVGGKIAFAAPRTVLAGRIVDAQTGRPMAGTVSIRTSEGSVLTEHASFRDGFRSDGVFEKEVPPGTTVITISRGFDYAAARQELTLREGERRDLEFRIARRTPLRAEGWHAGDNHVHMIHGERRIPVEFGDVALAARAEGLDYLSVAHHWNLPEPTPEALEQACARQSTAEFLMMWNLEAPKNYWRGDVSQCAGHGWTLGMRGRTEGGRDAIAELLSLSAWDYERHKPPTPNFEMHALIRSLGGMVSYTHPHRWWRGKWGGQGGYPLEEKKLVSNMAQELPFDTIAGPTYDSIDVMMQPREREVNRKAQELWFLLMNHGYRIAATASSDTTFDNPGGGVPGKVRVYTRLEGAATPAALAGAVKAGRNFVTSGPLVVLDIGGRRIGDAIRLDGPMKTKARIRAWASGHPGERLTRVELIRNGVVLRVFQPGADGFETTVELNETETAWYIARAYGSAPDQAAITNAIYFEGRGYQAPRPHPAGVTGSVRDAGTGAPLDGAYEVIRMVGSRQEVLSRDRFAGGRFAATVPATARLRVRADGYEPLVRSVFMDSPALLEPMLNMRGEQLSDWATFEEVKRRLGAVRLDFPLRRAGR
jgi:hypothetical protein